MYVTKGGGARGGAIYIMEGKGRGHLHHGGEGEGPSTSWRGRGGAIYIMEEKGRGHLYHGGEGQYAVLVFLKEAGGGGGGGGGKGPPLSHLAVLENSVLWRYGHKGHTKYCVWSSGEHPEVWKICLLCKKRLNTSFSYTPPPPPPPPFT